MRASARASRWVPATRRRAAGPAALLAALALLGAGCGADDDPTTSAAETVSTTTLPGEPATIREREEVEGGGEQGGGEPAAASPAADEEAAEREMVRRAQAVYRRYVAAINDRDGETLCELLAPGFEDGLELPEQGGSCAERISRSIGHRDPRGSPVWESTELDTLESAIVDDSGRVQLSVAIATRFADRGETSVESDIAFLEPARGGTYVLAKAPGSLWRAVGKPDVPPSVITPPSGF